MTSPADRPGNEQDSAWIDEVPFAPDGPPWSSMGLSRIDDAAWLLPDRHRSSELAERRQLVQDRRHDVVAALPGTDDARCEALEMVLAWEHDHRPDLAAEPMADDPDPLVVAALRTQEDLVVMGRHGDGHHLDAAVLCFPSHWRLREKLGGSALAVHAPVPGYAEDLSARVDRFLDRLRPGITTMRRNWTVHDTPERFAPWPTIDPAPRTPEEVPHSLWLRSERQTLRLLPRSGSVLFTIRVQQAPFGALARHPAQAAALAARVRAQPPAFTAMNGIAPHRNAVLSWLDHVVGSPG